MRIVLSGDDFRRLVAGETVRADACGEQPIPTVQGGLMLRKLTIELALADIGFGVMRAAIDQAEHQQSAATGTV